MMDIVKRLRQKGERVQIPCPDGIAGCLVYHYKIKTDPDCAEAADEIERLREALQKIVDFDWQFRSDGKLGKIEGPCAVIARSALQQKESE